MSSDQQYPYDPYAGQQGGRRGRHGRPAAPGPAGHPQGQSQGFGQPHGYGQPLPRQQADVPAPQGAPADIESTQTWQGHTWDTGSQPLPRWEDGPAHHAAAGPRTPPSPHPASPAPYGTPAPQGSFGADPTLVVPAPGAVPGPWQAAGPAPAPAHPGIAPGQVSPSEETAYLPRQDEGAARGVPGAYPLPPEMPPPGPGAASGPRPGEASHVTAGGHPAQARGPADPALHAAPTEALPVVPADVAAGPRVPTAAPGGAVPQRPGPQDASGYGAPSTLGNTRITDAQRARAEGRSPIIPPGIQPAGLTAALGLLLAGGAALGSYALVVPLIVLQAVTAAGWFRLNGMWPARQGIALAFLGGVVSDVVLLAAGPQHAAAAIIGTLGVWVLLVVILHLRSHADADTRMSSLMASVVSAALAIIATGHLAAPSDAVVVGAIAVAAATVVRALPVPQAASLVAALVVAAVAGAAMGGLTGFGAKGAVLGACAGACALIGLRAASYDYPSRFVHMTAGVALPLTAAAPVICLVGRALS